MSKHPRISYKAGSLENHMKSIEVDSEELGILEEVCDILEGGEKPFRKGKDKYSLSPKIKLNN